MAWSESDIPDQTGRTAIVTGANSGIGYETARALAAKGARVVLACRSEDKGRDAERRVRAAVPERRRPLRAARPRLARLGARLRREVQRRGEPTRPAREQRGRHDDPAREDRRRLRDPVRDQPSRPLRAHRPAAATHQDHAESACDQREQRHPLHGTHRFRRSPGRALLQPDARLRAEQARESALHAGAATPLRERAPRRALRRRAPGLDADRPPAALEPDGGGGGGVLAAAARRRAADLVCRHGARRARRRVLRSEPLVRHGRPAGARPLEPAFEGCGRRDSGSGKSRRS